MKHQLLTAAHPSIARSLLINATIAIAAILLVLLFQGCKTGSTEQTRPVPPSALQDTFPSPDAAVDSLVAALRNHDHEQLKQLFSSEGDEMLNSGDAVADRQDAAKFLSLYDEKHSLMTGDDNRVTLQVGNTDWPFPIPIIKGSNGWFFDTAGGKDEILDRRIGRNELFTIQTCLAVVDAQREYAMQDHGANSVPVYAQKFLSDEGQHNGLYWETSPGEPPSPLGTLVARASAEGYARRQAHSAPMPYHGYCYRMLKSQGPSAAGGALDYVVDDKMIGGFAVVAYPAEYGNSGVMTFIVNYRGIVYQKDLGPDTETIATATTVFDPGPGWLAAETAIPK